MSLYIVDIHGELEGDYEIVRKYEEQEPTTKNLAADIEDAIERLNALKQFIGYDKDSEIVKATQKSLNLAIKALEQEPVLDKIRAEIQNGTHHFLDGEPIIEIKEVLQIIDKYKAESE